MSGSIPSKPFCAHIAIRASINGHHGGVGDVDVLFLRVVGHRLAERRAGELAVIRPAGLCCSDLDIANDLLAEVVQRGDLGRCRCRIRRCHTRRAAPHPRSRGSCRRCPYPRRSVVTIVWSISHCHGKLDVPGCHHAVVPPSWPRMASERAGASRAPAASGPVFPLAPPPHAASIANVHGSHRMIVHREHRNLPRMQSRHDRAIDIHSLRIRCARGRPAKRSRMTCEPCDPRDATRGGVNGV